MSHTPGPWCVFEGDSTTLYIDDEFGAEGGRDYYLVELRHGDPDELKANAQRIVNCVNACEGLTDGQLADLQAFMKTAGWIK